MYSCWVKISKQLAAQQFRHLEVPAQQLQYVPCWKSGRVEAKNHIHLQLSAFKPLISKCIQFHFSS